MPRASEPSAPGAFSRWVPVVVWAAVISLLSTQDFAGEQTGRFLLPVLRVLLPGAHPHTIELVHLGVRKLAHAAEYALLAVLLQRALTSPERSFARVATIALLACVAYAALDELHQTIVPNRVGAVRDVAIDSLGAALGLALVAVLRRAPWLSAGRRLPA